MSTFPSDKGAISNSQSVEVSEGSIILGHHVYDKGRGWLRKAARVKPLVNLYSKLDMSAYKALGIKPPAKHDEAAKQRFQAALQPTATYSKGSLGPRPAHIQEN